MRERALLYALALVVVSLFSVQLAFLDTSPALAQSRTPPQATQHALDELANCRAQQRPDCPTETPTPTSTVTPTPTSAPTSTPIPTPMVEATATPPPALPIPDGSAKPLAGYVRPSSRTDPDVLELALPAGRWDVRVASDDACTSLRGAWTDVLLAMTEQGPAIADRAYGTDQAADWGPCGIVQVSWHAATPCASDDDGTCEAAADPMLIVALGDAQPTLQPAVVTDVPRPDRASTPTQMIAAPVQEVAESAQQQAQVIVQTVVVVVTATPADKPVLSPTTAPRATPASAPTVVRIATATSIPTATEMATPMRGTPTPRPAVASAPTERPVEAGAELAEPESEGVDWGRLVEIVGAVVVAAAVIWLVTRRRQILR